MLRKINLLLLSFLLSAGYTLAQNGMGSVKGKIVDEKTGDPLPFVNVIAYQNGIQKGGARTDFDGKFEITALSPGVYAIESSFVGYATARTEDVNINGGKITFLNNLTLGNSSKVLTETVVTHYKVPLIDKDAGTDGGIVGRDQIKHMAVRSVEDIASTVAGVYQDPNSGGISMRGGRSSDNSTYYYIDGIKVRGSTNLPKAAIEEVNVITGGTPANYGDFTGGIISITTRGPSSKYYGSLEAVSSGLYFKGKDPNGYDGKSIGLDKFGYSLVEGMISGPLLMRKDSTGKKTTPILGFFLSGNYNYQLDNRPLKGGSYRITQDARNQLLADPLRPTGAGIGTYYNSNFLTANSFEKTPYRMNASSKQAAASAKIDVNAGKNINLSFGGTMAYSNGTLNTNLQSGNAYSSSLMNFTNYGVQTRLDWRVYGKLTQRFTAKEVKGSASKFKSASYTLMVDYSNSSGTTQDPNHKDNLFSYGYVGKFTTHTRPSYALNATSDTLVQNGFKDYLVDFSPSTANSAFASITADYFKIYEGQVAGHYENLNQIQQGNGLRNGDTPDDVYNTWNSLGTPYNGYSKYNNAQLRVTGSGSVNIGDHQITLGFEFEQRTDRGYQTNYSPIGLWTVARQYLNSQIKELDVNNPTYTQYGNFHEESFDRLNTGYGATNGVYGGQKNGDQQTFFDYNVRNKFGYNPFGNDFINLDELDPSKLSIDMFSPDELLNSGQNFIQYYGYDYTGKRINDKTDVNNYFNNFDANGNYSRTVGAFRPTYISGYLMDKFSFDDLVFNVGVRVDVYSTNQPMLKDPFLVYSANDVSETRALATSNPGQYNWASKIPSSMGDDYTVYVNDVNNPTAIKGYREGTQWYDANGSAISDPSLIVGSHGIAPFLKNPTQTSPSADAFTKYKPQVNVMPRIAFSFPVSDKANFFAHYDILTQRPSSTTNRFNPIDYQYMSIRSVTVNNPALKPSKTIDYEFGFQQVVSKTSSIKISAFYREQRNMVQLQRFYDAYPRTYVTYGNRDFGTTKGLTVTYDMRRTGNIQLRVSYTLQFANGTGSDNSTAANLVNTGQPNLQNIFPYTYDRRNAFNIVFDYRYGEGKAYNGPRTKKGAQILKNTGLNITSNIFSGTPYSNQSYITQAASISATTSGLVGTLNGSRQPWTYQLNIQLDRTFNLKAGKKDEKGNKNKIVYMNVYLRVTNLLNTGNILNVYRSTGNANDDGYLAASKYQSSIQNQLDQQSFRNYYSMAVNNPYNYSSPRTIRLGVKFDF